MLGASQGPQFEPHLCPPLCHSVWASLLISALHLPFSERGCPVPQGCLDAEGGISECGERAQAGPRCLQLDFRVGGGGCGRGKLGGGGGSGTGAGAVEVKSGLHTEQRWGRTMEPVWISDSLTVCAPLSFLCVKMLRIPLFVFGEGKERGERRSRPGGGPLKNQHLFDVEETPSSVHGASRVWQVPGGLWAPQGDGPVRTCAGSVPLPVGPRRGEGEQCPDRPLGEVGSCGQIVCFLLSTLSCVIWEHIQGGQNRVYSCIIMY
uniref:Uncharacterized protein n=1 Tax=Molossus molossus TaxID=27622 RepID=A0A7J8ERJ7_MOLMO|nr:hypothetical protein HJG59_008693 [Molossus molossus]